MVQCVICVVTQLLDLCPFWLSETKNIVARVAANHLEALSIIGHGGPESSLS